MTKSLNNIFAGLLVVVAILSASAVTIWLGGLSERWGQHQFVVEFDLLEGVQGLDPGSIVMIGGEQVGTVTDVSFHFEPGEEDPSSIRAIISISDRFHLKEGAVAFLQRPLLGGSSAINFTSLGDGDRLASADPIDGRSAPSLLAAAGVGDEELGDVKRILDRSREFIDKANRFVDSAVEVSDNFRERWPEWSDRVDRVTANVDQTVEKGPKLADDLERRLDEVRQIIASGQSYLDDHRSSVDTIVGNIESGSDDARQFLDRLNNELADKASQLLDQGNDALQTAESALVKVDDAIDEEMPGVRRALANVRLATDQLAATTSEVRRSPWRLLFRPDTRELEFELLYDAARTYAGAVSDLRTTSEALTGTIDAADGSDEVDQERIDRLVGQLEDAFQRYARVEELFLQLVTEHSEAN